MRFITDCVSANGCHITDMVDLARQITYRTFKKYLDTDSFKDICEQLGYDRHLTLKRDYAVLFYKSQYRGRPCVYLCWSAIEYVFA